MAAPNIEMIAASLRSWSLGGGGGGDQSPPPHLAEVTDGSAGGITVELNSDTALPYHWEQCLDVRTGEIYYINRENGVRTTEDPRTAAAFSSAYSSSYYCNGDGTSDEYNCSRVGSEDNDYQQEEDDSEDNDYEEEEDGSDTADSSTLSCTSPHPRSPPPTRNPVAKFSSPLAARPASSTSWSPSAAAAAAASTSAATTAFETLILFLYVGALR